MAHLYYILPHFVIFVAYMSDNIQGHFFAGQPLFRTLMKKLKKITLYVVGHLSNKDD